MKKFKYIILFIIIIFVIFSLIIPVIKPLVWSKISVNNLCWDKNQDTKLCYEKNGLLNGQGAFEYCRELIEDGYDNWRLPKITELKKEMRLRFQRGSSPKTGTQLQFVEGNSYCADNQGLYNTAFYANLGYGGSMGSHNAQKPIQKSVLCVRGNSNIIITFLSDFTNQISQFLPY